MNLWASVQGFKNIREDRPFYAYSNRTCNQNINISIPFNAVSTFDYSVDDVEGIEFSCLRKSDWKL